MTALAASQGQATRVEPSDWFAPRHLGPTPEAEMKMLASLGCDSLDALIDAVIPHAIRHRKPLELPAPAGERAMLDELRLIAAGNLPCTSYIGMGYHDCITPPVILRNVLENPGWYTQYTPYQSEIAQGRLEALLNFQTMLIDLTGMEIANASLLDEATAAAEAMSMAARLHTRKGTPEGVFFVDAHCHPQTIEVLRTRARPLGIRLEIGDHATFDPSAQSVFGALLQYPTTDGEIPDYGPLVDRLHAAGALAIVAADPLALTLLRPPGEFGADVVVGSTQRFGVPLGYGGPHAAYMATQAKYQRQLPGRIAGLSTDSQGKPGLRLALQTREQHIRREKATSNICTAQVLLAVIASMYAVYHGPDGLKRIAQRVHGLAETLRAGLLAMGYTVQGGPLFDTVTVDTDQATMLREAATDRLINLRFHEDGRIGISLDETTHLDDLEDLFDIFALGRPQELDLHVLLSEIPEQHDAPHQRTSPFMTHPVFHRYHSETELLRYLHRLQSRDLSLTTSMIPLGSCTMKLNATSEMLPVTWPEFAQLHPYAPRVQAQGYQQLFDQLKRWLAEITGFQAVSLQPNAGSQGEYAGLLVIQKYHEQNGQDQRDICLIPTSAHGTNPASASMAGMSVVGVGCDENGNIDLDDLRSQAEKHRDALAALMVTYPSTHGVFEETIREVCQIVHENGGQVYMDGANLNAMVGLCRPGDIGADVCHLNLHKTFCIPHGGGGPGMGPIGVAQHLAALLPKLPVLGPHDENRVGAVSAAPYGSPSILPISWAYIRLMGASGLTRASKIAILNANYIARRLEEHYPVLYKGAGGLVAHECILDLRHFKKSAGIEVGDVAKRLMDYGFHAPTISWPVPGTMMVEPTESESLEELDRFCDALVSIRSEISEIERGDADRDINLLTQSPHTAEVVTADNWDRPYSRERAAYPAPWTREQKFWPAVGRIDNVAGDRNLACACPPVAAYEG